MSSAENEDDSDAKCEHLLNQGLPFIAWNAGMVTVIIGSANFCFGVSCGCVQLGGIMGIAVYKEYHRNRLVTVIEAEGIEMSPLAQVLAPVTGEVDPLAEVLAPAIGEMDRSMNVQTLSSVRGTGRLVARLTASKVLDNNRDV